MTGTAMHQARAGILLKSKSFVTNPVAPKVKALAAWIASGVTQLAETVVAIIRDFTSLETADLDGDGD